MTIEASNSNVAVRQSKHSDVHRNGKGHSPGADHGAGSGADFMSVLTGVGLGDDSQLIDAASTPNPIGADLLSPLGSATVLPVTDLGVASIPAVAADPSVLALPQISVSEAPGDLTGASAALTGAISATVESTALGTPSVIGALALGTRLDQAGDAKNMGVVSNTDTPLIERGKPSHLASASDIANHLDAVIEKGRLSASDGISSSASVQTEFGIDLKAVLAQKAAKMSAGSAMNDNLVSSREVSGGVANAKTASTDAIALTIGFDPSDSMVSAAPAISAVSTELTGLRRENARVRATERAAIADPMASPSAPALAPTGSLTADIPTVQDVYIAERVAYWISNDVQKAELKLDGLGDQPVEVSIRLQGNEAHVAFRTDEIQARNALEHAGSQLRQMLQNEGLMLAGVSVGTTGTGSEQRESDRKGRPADVRVGSVTVAREPDVARPRTAGLSVGRSLDLFV